MSADEIREYIQRKYIEPARQRDENKITIRAGDVHDGMRLKDRQPLVCDTLRGSKLHKQCKIRLVNEKWGENVHQQYAKNIWFTYQILN